MKRLKLSLALGLGAVLLGAGLAPAEARDRHRRDDCRIVDRRGHRHHGRQVHVRGRRGHVHTHCHCRPVQIPGYYRTVYETVQEPGCYEKVWIPPTYRTIQVGCEVRRVLVCPGRYETVYRPGQTRRVAKKVWVAARFEFNHSCGR